MDRTWLDWTNWTFQRQSLSMHIKDACQYVEISCSEEQCDKIILHKDVGKHEDACVYRSTQCDGCGVITKHSDLSTHNSECSSKFAICGFYYKEFPRSQSQTHAASCPDYEIPCTHANNGCPWNGLRRQFSDEHVPSCPYEAIREIFFNRRHPNITALTQKIQALEFFILFALLLPAGRTVVFGKILEGVDIVYAIEDVPEGSNDCPMQGVVIYN